MGRIVLRLGKLLLNRVADRVQRMVAKSRFLVRVAILIRNQARCVIKYHLAEGPSVRDTGEAWLREKMAIGGARFMDVGANVGDWLSGIVAVKGNAPFELIAFEPSSSAAARLRERFASDPRISIIDAAAGDAAGVMQFVEERDAGKGSTLVPGFGQIHGHSRTVKVTTIDEELARAGWDKIDLLKIDAEGYDARVIRGAAEALRRNAIAVVQFEYNRSWQLAGETLFACYRMLEEFGYRVYLLKRDGLWILNYGLYEEYYEYSNFVAIAPSAMPRFESLVRGTI